MEMRKIACAVLVAAASATAAMAAEAPAPGPASGSFAVTPAVGAVIGASVVSFFAFYLHPYQAYCPQFSQHRVIINLMAICLHNPSSLLI
ncbi:arabinogalactan protein 23-like [Canna indica]|uniref:Arabinogalactan protein 23-like n=1 Tax=Canna indica TaxID=4628 RepID=A0AAQ3KPN3_9LILI|nr:arabinogalactan protein 23-like [Canna indica]